MILLHIFTILQTIVSRTTFSSLKMFVGIDLLLMKKVTEREGLCMCEHIQTHVHGI